MIENGTVTKEVSMKKKIPNKLTYIFGKPLTYVYIFVISFIAGIVCYYFGYKDISWGFTYSFYFVKCGFIIYWYKRDDR